MTAANRNFQKLIRRVHAINAWKSAKDKETELPIYPSCRGTFDTCPTEEEFKITIEKDKYNPPSACKHCVIFKESKFYTVVVDDKRLELWKKLQVNE